MRFEIGDRFNVGWQSTRQPITDLVDSWLPKGGDTCPGRMTVFPLRKEEFVVVAPFLPQAVVLESLRAAGRFGWILAYDPSHLAPANYLAKQLPITATLGPDRLRSPAKTCKSLGQFHNGYQMQVKALYGSASQGLAVTYRTSKHTTLLLSHVIKPTLENRWQLARRLTRDSHHCPKQIGKHLIELGSRRAQLSVVFHGETVWHLGADEWIDACRRSMADAVA